MIGEMSRNKFSKIRFKDRKSFGNEYLQPTITGWFNRDDYSDKPIAVCNKYRLTAQGKMLRYKGLTHDVETRRKPLPGLVSENGGKSFHGVILHPDSSNPFTQRL